MTARYAAFLSLATVLLAHGGHAEQMSPSARTQGGGCPFGFGSEMPPDTFCVYRGTAYSARGDACATDVVAIWSNHSGNELGGDDTRDLFVGFVGKPELVLRAEVSEAHVNRAEIVDYTMGEGATSARLAGSATLERAQRDGDTLRIAVHGGDVAADSDCAFASYVGTVIGVAAAPPAAITQR